MKAFCRWVLLWMLPLLAATAQADGLVLRVMPARLHLGEPLRLIITPPEQFSGTVDLHPLLRNFVILGTATHGEMAVDHNRVRRRVQWTVTLLPRRTGHLHIPPLQFGAQRSGPIPVTVLPAR